MGFDRLFLDTDNHVALAGFRVHQRLGAGGGRQALDAGFGTQLPALPLFSSAVI